MLANLSIKTVAAHAKGYTNWQYEQVTQAHCILQMIGNPLNVDFKNIMHCNLLSICLVSIAIIDAATYIFWTSIASIEWKTRRKVSGKVVIDYMVMLPQIWELYQK